MAKVAAAAADAAREIEAWIAALGVAPAAAELRAGLRQRVPEYRPSNTGF